ncbi:DNA repair protein RecO [Tenuibacillus multivorans]|uniref:DNA repair protein RecO n=1 Tax=Tenuibacillus multivorans TaxID=237069 RepID=A0A1G9ZF63_9BACI|nr:DNA repair protein RecO [Tenuibacillus multivorans]GEL78309.1 DNA repair protein RecO [Tenuibacillus multivorans]SDN19093.1 DNA replication and repair protein RecO [Tenuibacillus multivorans]
MIEKVQGIVLRTRDYGETNKIITLYTKEYGLISAVARGAKKTKSRMAAITQPFIYGLFLTQIGKGLGTIHQGDILNSMRGIREDIIKTAYASYMCELVAKMVNEKEPNSALFDELNISLERMLDDEPPEAISIMFELKMYHIGGFAPVVHNCVNGHDDRPITAFSVVDGGVVCDMCQSSSEYTIPLPAHAYKVLRQMSLTSIKRIRNISIKHDTLKLLRHILDQYYERYGGMTIKSKRFLDQMHLLDHD